MNLWEEIDRINAELKKDFLCVPPYQCITGRFVGELAKNLRDGNINALKIRGTINQPWQRAYQIEYRYKHCKIFEPFMSAIEYATYDALSGNWICAYLAFLPIVEAVLRKWAEEEPALSFNKMKGFAPNLIQHLKSNQYFDDDRINWTNSHIEFLQYILCNVLYEDFDAYGDKSFSDTFNRNLSLHKLEGVMDMSEGLSNVTRILLVLDIIAELYFMQTPKEYWECTFYAVPDENLDFMLRWKLYVKRAMLSVGPNDILILQNAFLKPISDEIKKAQIAKLEFEIKFISKKTIKDARKTVMKFICYPKCTTCQKAKKWLDDNKIEYELRDIKEDNPSLQELTAWYKMSGLPLKKFFNTSGLLYKSMGLKDMLPSMTEEEQLKLLATDGMLVKRPLIIGQDFVLVGFKESEWSEKL